MPRPPMPLGTHGKIRTYRHGDGWKARTLYRDWDGTTRHVQKHGRTQAAADRALVESLRDRHRSDAGALITPDTRVDALAEAWWSEVEQASHPATPPALAGTTVTALTVRSFRRSDVCVCAS